MEPFRVDAQKCNQDELCVQACPTGVIRMPSGGQTPVPTVDFGDWCLACGHCVAVCPTQAFRLSWLGPEDCLAFEKDLRLDDRQAEQFLRSRRSIRNFKNQPVERWKLEKLLQMACYAPSAKNSQPWHWTVIQEPAEVRRLASMVVDWMRSIMDQYPQQARERGFLRVVAAWDAGQERICRGAPHVIVVHGDKEYGFGAEDSALAISHIELFAPVLGLGSCWGGYFYSAVNWYPPLFEALGLPADHRAFGAVMVGYPQLRYQRMPQRKPPRVVWH